MITAGSRFSLHGVGLLAAALTAFVASAARADLFVSSDSFGTVLQYDENTGDFLNDFLSLSGMSGSVGSPRGVLFGPDGNLYVASSSLKGVLRFDSTGNFIDTFVTGGSELNGPRGIIFGPDGHLYVSSKNNSSVVRYDGKTGQFIDTFVPSESGGLNGARGLVFGPDGNLYVGSFGDVVAGGTAQVLRYDGATGAFMDVFASDSLSALNGLCFGPDGNLYVSNGGISINRYDGTTGQLIDILDPTNNAMLGDPNGILFGPDGNLYVDDLSHGGVRRYDGTTGDFMDIFVDPGTSGNVSYMTFTKTDPTTLNYKP